MNCHESPKLNRLLGAQVLANIAGLQVKGVLLKPTKEDREKLKIKSPYMIIKPDGGHVAFSKTHVNWIEEI